jgi:hypothetical protein
MAEFPWARIHRHGANRGGGIFLTSQLVVTAAHCLDGVRVGHEADAVCVSLGHGTPIPAQLVERVDTNDLALLKLTQPIGLSARLPLVSPCRRGDEWFAPARPTTSDPELDGAVTATVPYTCVAGGLIQAVQLTTQTPLGHYEGYSGGPVFLSPEDANKVIGLLIEQYPDRIDPDRATNTLFAAAIQGVMEQFDSLRSAYLIRTLMFENLVPARRPVPDVNWADAENVVGWHGLFDVVEPEVRSLHQALVSKWATRQGDETGET